MPHEIIVEDRARTRRAVVSEGNDGCVVRYYDPGSCGRWVFNRECLVRLPMHAALNLVQEVIGTPPRVGGK